MAKNCRTKYSMTWEFEDYFKTSFCSSHVIPKHSILLRFVCKSCVPSIRDTLFILAGTMGEQYGRTVWTDAPTSPPPKKTLQSDTYSC